MIANGGTIFSTILGIVSFYFIPKNWHTFLIVTLIVIIISLLSSAYLYVNDVNKYIEHIEDENNDKEALLKKQQTKLDDITQKHKALSEQFSKNSKNLDSANHYFEILATFVAQSLSFTAPPYTKKQENERYNNLLQIINEFRSKSKEE